MDIFETLKGVSFGDAARRYGLSVNNAQFCLCPFHKDSHPSMKIYPDHGYCFVCHVYADSVKLVEHLFNLSPLDAAKKLAADFSIRIEEETPATFRARKNLLEERAEETRLAEKMADSLSAMFYQLHRWEKEYSPLSPKQLKKVNKKYLIAVNHKDFLGALLNEYVDASKDIDTLISWRRRMQSLSEIYILGQQIRDLQKTKNKKRKDG